jgi:hypothetical protein
VLVKSGTAVCQEERASRVYDGFAAERGLAGSAAATGLAFLVTLSPVRKVGEKWGNIPRVVKWYV